MDARDGRDGRDGLFRKDDSGKSRWDLLPLEPIHDMVRVLTYGAEKYEDNNWRLGSANRYYAAFFRHLYAWYCGKRLDEESGLPHLAHCMTNLAFICVLSKGPCDDGEE